MKANSFLVVVVAVVLCSAGANVISQEEELFLNVYRDSTGHLSDPSKRAAEAMKRIADAQGYVTLWLTLNFDYNLYLDGETDQAEIAAQEQAVRDGFDAVLNPLIASGDVLHPTAGPFIKGPGCLVRASSTGLKKLVKDNRVWQIVGVE